MPGPDFPPGTRRSQEDSLDIDISAAHPARVYDYWLGGTENFAADRAAATRRPPLSRASWPRSAPTVPSSPGPSGTWPPRASGNSWISAPASRPPTTRTRWRSGPPQTPGSSTWTTTRSSRSTRPGCCQPPARGRPASSRPTSREPDTILAQAQRTLDFSQPVAIMLLGILPLIPDADDPSGIVARLSQPGRPGQLPGHLPPGRGQPGRGAGPRGRAAQRAAAHRPGTAQPRRRAAHVQRVHPGPAGARAAGPVASGTGRLRHRPALHRARRGGPQVRGRGGRLTPQPRSPRR